MKNRYALFLLPGFLLIFSQSLSFSRERRSEEHTAELIVRIAREFRSVEKVIDLQLGEVKFITYESSHIANADPNLYINLQEINTHIEGETEDFAIHFIHFVIAHEIAHKVQFSHYQPKVIAAAKGEGKIFPECNADIIAGFLISSKINAVDLQILLKNPGFDLKAYNENIQRIYFAVYRKIYDMDKGNQLIVTHPSRLQRIKAARSGVIIGNSFNEPQFKQGHHVDQVFRHYPGYKEFIYEFKATSSPDSVQVLERLKQMVKRLSADFYGQLKENDTTIGTDIALIEFKDERYHKIIEARVEKDYDGNFYILVSIYGK